MGDGHTLFGGRRLVAGALVAGAMTLASGCQGTLRAGQNALSAEEYERAEASARVAIAKRGHHPDNNLLMAQALVGQERWADAEPYAKRAFDYEGYEASAGRIYGKVLWELGRPVEAVEAWRMAREADTDSVSDDDFVRALEKAIDEVEQRHDFERSLALREELKSVRPEHAYAAQTAMDAAMERHAKNLEVEGSYDGAIEVLEELEASRPEHPAYPWARGRLLATLGRDDDSAAAFDRYVSLADESDAVTEMEKVANEAEQLGAYGVAASFYERAIAALPDEPSRRRAQLHRRLAALLLSSGRSDEGAEHLRAFVSDRVALAPRPAPAQIYLQASDVATQNRHPNLAVALLEEAIEKASQSWMATQRLAVLYARRSRTADVERVLNQFIDRADDKVVARIRAGRWASSRRSFDLAKFHFEQAVQDDGAPANVWLELARVYSALGDTSEVRRTLQAYAKRADNRRRALLEIATIYQSQRMYDEAEAALKAALREQRDDLLTVKQLEDLYREWGRPQKIHDVYASWAKARGNKPEDFQVIGERFFRQQEWDDALPYLERAAKAGQSDAWLQIADIHSRQRKERDMKEALERYLETSADRARALNAVLQRYRVSNWNHEAIPILEELVSLEPRNVLHYEQLSQLYFEQGRDVEAFELWKRYISMSPNPIASLETMARRFQRRNHPEWMLQFLHQVLEQEEDPDPRLYRLLGDAYADSRANSRPMWSSRASIFTADNKAKEYYGRYLDEAKPTRGELQSFAESMRAKQYWEIAGQAYERLKAESAGLQPHLLINYGIVLLNLGRAQEAEVVFADYYDDRQRSVDAALAIADQLFVARRYVAVEPYLRDMLERGDDGLVRQAFMRLAEIYWRSDRTEEIPGLANEFLARTQNPTEGRRTVEMMLEAAGMWDESAEQLRSMRDLQGDDVGYSLGVTLFRSGRRDEADDAFRDFASNHVNPSEAWRLVGDFWDSRGEVERAGQAYQNAANSGGQDDVIHATLGRFQIANGKVKEGRQSFERARSNIPHAQRGSLYRMEVEALTQAGRFAEAREAARDAAATAFLDRDFFYTVFARAELQSGDEVRSQRMVDELQSSNLPLELVVRHLRDAGYIERAAELVEEEIASGDYILGGNVLLQYPDIFTRTGGIDRLMRVAQPLIEKSARDPQTSRRLGELLLSEGYLEEGAMLLRRAYELGDAQLVPDLASAYASLGHHEEAFEILQAGLANDDQRRLYVLVLVGLHYEVIGERARFTQLLEHLSRDPRFAVDAMGLLVSYRVEDGAVAEVVDTIHRLVHDRAGEQAMGVEEDHDTEFVVAAVVAAVEALSAAGFEHEAVQILNRAPQHLRDHETIRDLRLRVAAFGGTLDAEREFELALDGLGTSSSEERQRIQIAQLAAHAGRNELAAEIAAPSLTSPDFDISSRALRVLLKTARVEGQHELIDRWIREYLDHNVDRVGARQAVISELLQLGLDDRALSVASVQATKVPVDAHVATAMSAAQRAGKPEALAKWADRLVEVHQMEAMVDLQNDYRHWSLRQHDRLNAAVRDAAGPKLMQPLALRLLEVQNLYRIGKPFEAREQIATYLASVDYDAQAVEQVLEVLDHMKLRGDIARVVGPMVPDENLSLPSRRLIGLANLSIGFSDTGVQMLDRAIAVAPDAATEAAIVADELVARALFEPALRFAERAVSERPGRPDALAVRGLARLGTNDVDGAREDLDAALLAGVGRNELLRRAGTIALRRGHRALAQTFLEQLFVSFDYAPTAIRPIYASLRAFQDGGAPEVGVEFIERLRPHIALGHGLAGNSLTGQLSSMYEDSGRTQRAFAVYEDGVRRLGFSNPFSSELAQYRNNLAYTFSTTNEFVEPGIQLVLEAIANQGRREANYIDTLGWLYYRQGDLEAAEAEIRRALRSSASNNTDDSELYYHLAEIRAARGYNEDAAWLRIFADSIRAGEN